MCVCVCVQSLSRVQLSATPWTVARQAPLSMGSSSQEYWSGLPFPAPEDLPAPGIEPRSPPLQADSLPCEPPGKSAPKEEPTQTSLSGELIDKVWPTHTRRRGEALTVLPRGQTPQILC